MEEHNKVCLRYARFINTTASVSLSLLAEASLNEFHSSAFSGTGYIRRAYSRVMDMYSRVISYYNFCESEIDSQGKAMLTSIRAIFYARLSEYKKILQAVSGFEESETGNINFSEKIRSIIALHFNEMLAEINKNYMVHMWNMDSSGAQELAERIKNDIMRRFSNAFFEAYTEFSHQAKALDEKPQYVALLSLDRIKQEYNILGAIIRIQMPGFEMQSRSRTFVNEILRMIRSEYEHLDADINHIEALNRAKRESSAADSDFLKFMERILAFLNSKDTLVLNKDKFLSEYEVILNYFDEWIKTYWRKQSKEGTYNFHLLYRAKLQDVLRTEALFEGIKHEFDSIFDDISKNMEDYRGDEHVYQIIKGIHETISVKRENMNEMFEEYLECLAPASDNAVSSEYEFEKDIDEIIAEYKDSFYSFLDREASIKLLEDFYKTQINKFNSKNLQMIEEILESEKDSIRKADYKFRKECLFFEIITFEEIISYSASKLRDSENEAALKCSKLIEGAALNIKELLSEYGIEVIAPELGEMFNGRLHEVIMTREEEGFMRGAIIKVISNGYKEGNIVFARANVICAK